MSQFIAHGHGYVMVFVGRLRIRWVPRDHRPYYSERVGHTRWLKIGRLGFRWMP